MTAIALKEKEATLTKKMVNAHAEASSNGGFDFDLVKSLSGETSDEKLNEYRKLNEEMSDVRKQIETLELAEKNSREYQEREAEQNVDPEVTKNISKRGKTYKTIGEAIVNSDVFKMFKATKTPMAAVYENIDIKAATDPVGTGQDGTGHPEGYLPESIRRPGLEIMQRFQRPMVVDIVPEGRTDTGIVTWSRELAQEPDNDGRNAAAERFEGADYGQSSYNWDFPVENVRTIGHFVVVTDEMLEDVAAMEGMLNTRLTNAIRRRLSYQFLNGDGVAPNLKGLLLGANSHTRNKAANTSTPDILLTVLTARQASQYDPNALVIHPNNWAVVRGLKDANRNYIFGNPASNVVDNMWGLVPVITSEIPENTALIGDFTDGCMQFTRRGLEIRTGFMDDQFKKGLMTIRAGVRSTIATFNQDAFENVKTLNTAQHP